MDTSTIDAEQTLANSIQNNVLSDSDSFGQEQNQTLSEHPKDTSLRSVCATCVEQNMADDLREVVSSWDHLLDAVKRGIVAMVRVVPPEK